MGAEHGRALAWARAQAGRHEIPNGSNRGPFVELCQRATWLPGSGWPWCAAFFVAAWRYGAGVVLPYRGAGAYAWLAWAKQNGCAIALEDAEPGDGVVLNIGAGHMAMLARPYTRGAGVVHTIDGNWSDRVELVTHPAPLVRGCVHVREPQDPLPPVAPARPPMFDVATSASGTRRVVYVSGVRAIARKLPALLRRFPTITITRRSKP